MTMPLLIAATPAGAAGGAAVVGHAGVAVGAWAEVDIVGVRAFAHGGLEGVQLFLDDGVEDDGLQVGGKAVLGGNECQKTAGERKRPSRPRGGSAGA